MKPRTIFYLVILLSSIIHLQSSCVKNHPDPKPKELPPITTEGRNTIGFLLNGEVWLPGGGGIGHPDKEFVLDTINNIFFIKTYYDTRNKPIIRQDFFLRVNLDIPNCSLGSKIINEPSGNRFFIDYNFENNCIDFIHYREYKVEIIYCDLNLNIISGTFELTIENACGDIYEITDGRFDARFRYF
jgi:hypothetical protein